MSGLDFCSDWDRDLGLGLWEMDLDEEGRTILGFGGLERREWDGRWNKKKKPKEEDGEQEIEP